MFVGWGLVIAEMALAKLVALSLPFAHLLPAMIVSLSSGLESLLTDGILVKAANRTAIAASTSCC